MTTNTAEDLGASIEAMYRLALDGCTTGAEYIAIADQAADMMERLILVMTDAIARLDRLSTH